MMSERIKDLFKFGLLLSALGGIGFFGAIDDGHSSPGEALFNSLADGVGGQQAAGLLIAAVGLIIILITGIIWLMAQEDSSNKQ